MPEGRLKGLGAQQQRGLPAFLLVTPALKCLAPIFSIKCQTIPQLMVVFGQKNLNLIVVFQPIFSYTFNGARGRQISSTARQFSRSKWTNKRVSR
jgi:hypothetical protein